MSTLLFIGHVWPEPTSSAAGARTLTLLRLFARRFEPVVFASAAVRGERAAALEQELSQVGRIALNDASFDSFVADLAPDLVVFDRFMTEEQFGWRVERQCPDAMRILDTVDLHFLRDARRESLTDRDSVADTSAPGRITELALREVAAILRCDLTLLTSAKEISLLNGRYGVDVELLHRVPLLLEEADFAGEPPGFDRRNGFATIGNFRHAPNHDSVLWLRERIWPLIRARSPQAELHVYGAYAPKNVTALDDPDRGFRVEGWTHDSRDALAGARVCLAPLRFGAGLKGKLADAMVAGTPSVTTSIGAESMSPETDWCGSIADTPEAIAAAAVELHDDETRWTRMQKRGFEIARREFDAEREGSALLERIHECGKDLSARRQSNVAGAMLRYHRHRSTEYMSRWIEAKSELEGLKSGR